MNKRYKLGTLDCAGCAGRLESALRESEGLGGAIVSFSGSWMEIPEERLEEAKRVVKRVDPGVRVIVGETGPDDAERFITRFAC